MRESLLILVLTVLFITPQQHLAKKNTPAVYFEVAQAKNVPVNFDDNNSLKFKNGLKIQVTEKGEDSYIMKVQKEAKILFSIKGIKGVSKVLMASGKLFFCVFTYVDEDGNNEGYAYIIDVNSGRVQKFAPKLKNTCNPTQYNGNYVFYSDGAIIMTDFSLENKRSIPIAVTVKHNDLTFLDTYSLNGLCGEISGSNKLQLLFALDRTSERAYEGTINELVKKIVLRCK